MNPISIARRYQTEYRRKSVVLPCAVVLCCATGTGCAPKEPDSEGPAPQPPNILWFIVESLRADHIGSYGYERDTTPNLDAFSSQATRYENAYAVTSWTLASHATMFTGLYPSAHQAVRPQSRLANDHQTVAESLGAAGYQTAAVASGPYFRPAHNLQQGFEHFDTSPITPTGKSASKDVTNPAMEASIERFLRSQRRADRPFFLFGYFWDPHSQYIPPPPYDTMFVPPDAEPIAASRVKYAPYFKLGKHISPAQLRYLIAQYDGEIRCTDEVLGRIFATLRELGLWNNTAIIVTSDHGEEFYDHGFNSHKNTLYVESLHVPLWIKWPEQKQGDVDERIVNLIDLHATAMDLAGLASPDPNSSLSLRAAPRQDRSTFYELLTLWTFSRKSTGESWQESDQWYAVRRGPYKLVHVATQQRWELYDLRSDPGEQHPVTSGAGEILGEFQGELERWQDTMRAMAQCVQPGGQANLTEAELRHLRALGYVP